MPSDLHDEDEDFYGTPKRKQEHVPLLSFRRLRKWSPLLTIIFVVTLYWTRPWPKSTAVRWSKYAYSLYAADDTSLCNALMVFESLHKLGSKANRVLLHNPEWSTAADGGKDRNSQLLTMAEKRFKVMLRPVTSLDEKGGKAVGLDGDRPQGLEWSITKLRAFDLVEYDRVLHLDSDIALLQNLDELFLLPKTPMAMPRAYWTDSRHGQWPLTPLMILLEPNPDELRHMIATVRAWRMDPKYKAGTDINMDLLNGRFGSSALVLPHRPYALQSAEFRRQDHSGYLGTTNAPSSLKGTWNADAVLKEAKVVHFNDWPLPKPWMMWPHEGLAEIQPNCTVLGDGDFRISCREREVWKGLYDDFCRKRRDLCGILSVQSPDWRHWKHAVGAD